MCYDLLLICSLFSTSVFLLLCGKRKKAAQAFPPVNNSVAQSVVNVPQSKKISATPSQVKTTEQKNNIAENKKPEDKPEPSIQLNFSESKNVRKEQSVNKASLKAAGNGEDLNEEDKVMPSEDGAERVDKLSQPIETVNKSKKGMPADEEEKQVMRSERMDFGDASKICKKRDVEEGSGLDSDDQINIAAPNSLEQQDAKFSKQTKELTVNPVELIFSRKGGTVILRVVNLSNKRMAIKMKCTDNENYAFDPVFFLMEPKSTRYVEIAREKAPAKNAQAGVYYTQAPAEVVSAEEVFTSSVPTDKVKFIIIPISVL
uniref:Major sperm protein n=1 Tax=Ditylenchus dipsaci TaxID=166011 RepID=A0A915DIS6_9BILA